MGCTLFIFYFLLRYVRIPNSQERSFTHLVSALEELRQDEGKERERESVVTIIEGCELMSAVTAGSKLSEDQVTQNSGM